MNIRDCIRIGVTTRNELAAALGCDPSHVSRIALGRRVISILQARAIVEATGGRVTYDTLADLSQAAVQYQAAKRTDRRARGGA